MKFNMEKKERVKWTGFVILIRQIQKEKASKSFPNHV